MCGEGGCPVLCPSQPGAPRSISRTWEGRLPGGPGTWAGGGRETRAQTGPGESTDLVRPESERSQASTCRLPDAALRREANNRSIVGDAWALSSVTEGSEGRPRSLPRLSWS